jgi:hypothetical protein
MLSNFRASVRHPGNPLSSAKVLLLVALVTALCACQKSSHDHLTDARSELAGGAFDASIAAAQTGLESAPSKADAWGLELVMLEAYARGGNGEETKQQLIKLAGLYPQQLSPTDYSGTAQQLQTVGQGPAAIEVLDIGKKRYPDNELIDKMIADSVNAESSPEELELLKSLGYIE